MADFDSQLPIRSLAANNETRLADSANTIINPAKEDGNLATVKTNTDPLVTAGAGGYIRQDSTDTIAKETGGNLDAIAADTTTLAGGVTAGIYQENVAQVGGNATETGHGAAGSGSARVAAVLDVGGSAVSNANPVPVFVTTSSGATNTDDYNTSAALAANASSTHTFTPAADFLLQRITASASGQMKVVVQYGVTGAEATKEVQFTSKGQLVAEFVWDEPLSITTADTVKVIRTNLDNQAMDVYSTIKGVDA